MQIIANVTETPELQARNSRGQRKFWQAFGVKTDAGGYCYYTVAWHELDNGAMSARTTSELNRVKGKNLGRSNETSDEAQLVAEVAVLERKKRDAGYCEAGAEPEFALPLPMLAYKYPERKMTFPCLAQPKLDGYRCITNGDVFWSRKGKFYPDVVVQQFIMDTGGLVLDGELMLPPGFPFEQVKSATAKFNPELTPKLSYHVFDCVDPDLGFDVRYANLVALFNTGTLPENVVLVGTGVCRDAEHAEERLQECLDIGYEGVMLRAPDGKYQINHRSASLLKFKLMMKDGELIGFEDDEFEVIGCTEGRGREAGAIIYVCQTAEGREFNVRPEGTIEERKSLWVAWTHERYFPVGKWLTVRFQQYSCYKVPRFPVGKAFRDE